MSEWGDTDGTPAYLNVGLLFKSQDDEEREHDAAAIIEARWECRLHRFADLCPLDWYAERSRQLIGVLEMKARTHSLETYPTVFLSVRKWLALLLAQQGLGVPALFVARFTDAIRWIPAADVKPAGVRIDGHRFDGLAAHERRRAIEPLLEVPITEMREL